MPPARTRTAISTGARRHRAAQQGLRGEPGEIDREQAEPERLAREPALLVVNSASRSMPQDWHGARRQLLAPSLLALLLRSAHPPGARSAARSLPDARRYFRPMPVPPPARRSRAARPAPCRDRACVRRRCRFQRREPVIEALGAVAAARFRGHCVLLFSGVDDLAAVRMQHLPGHVGGVLAGEEHVAGRDLVRLAGAPHRHVRAEALRPSRPRTSTGSAASRSAPARRR